MTESLSSSNTPRALYLFMLLALAYALVEIFANGLTNDTNTLLHYSIYILQDGGMYEHRFEVNPPLIMLLYLPPAFAILHWHWDPAMALHAYTFLACCLSVFMVHRALVRGNLPPEKRRIWVATSIFLLIMLPPFPPVYGDREHWLYILAMPWLLPMLLGLAPSRAAGFLAGVGCCIKPYNLILFGVVLCLGGKFEGRWYKRFFSGPVFAAADAVLLYIIVVLHYFPHYLTDIIPAFWGSYATVYSSWLTKTLKLAFFSLAPIPFLKRAGKKEQIIWGGFFLTTVVLYCSNGGWWYLDYVLCIPLTLIAVAFLTHDLNMPLPPTARMKKFAYWVLGLLMLFSMLGLGAEIEAKQKFGYSRNQFQLPPKFLHDMKEAAGTDFILLSTDLWATALTPMDGTPRHVYGHDWLVLFPWWFHHPDAPADHPTRRLLVEPLLESLQQHPTLMVDVSTKHRGLPDHTDIKKFFERDTRVAAIFSHYILVETLDGCTRFFPDNCRFAVWKYEPASPAVTP